MLEGVPDVGVARQEAAGAAAACLERGLARSAAWLAQLAAAIGSKTYAAPVDDRETGTYLVCKSLFDCREYDRAAHFSTDAITPRVRFLHFYSRYLSDENKRLDSMTEAGCSPDSTKSAALRELYDALRDECASERADGYLLYLYGVVSKKLNLDRLALRVLCESVRLTPWLWGAWLELASLPRDRETLDSLDLPRHCMTHFFYAHAYLEQKLADEALDAYENLKAAGFDKFTYLNAQMAVAYHDLREVDSAIATFRTVQQNDPFRLDNLDIYSHLLYVKEMRTELANLAHKVVEIDKYKVETCCIIGNYYSLRSEHQKAVVYFQRALRLNPNYLSAWILMGHEFIELQNTNAAIQSYRQAIEVNRNDYRAWNGLGQAYEILGLHGYCLYYYARAAQQRPNDSRMLVALGQAYEELNKIPNALKCYHRAHSVGDIEGMAILKLATLYDKVGMCDSAAAAYTSACLDSNTDADKGLQEAYKYLAYYHLKKNHLDDAHNFAFKCLDYEETKEEGKTLLKNIAQKKASMRDTNNPGTAEEGVEKMAETSDLSTSMKSTSTTGLNYTPYNSPPQTGISSKYKLGSDGDGSKTRVGGHDCSLGGGVADGALQPVTMANLFGTWLSTWLTERGADEAVYAGYVSAILAGDEPPQDQRQELIDLLADMLEGDVEKHVQEIMEKWQACHPVEENKESASSVDVEDRLVQLLGSQSLATLTPKQCTDEEKKVKQAILSQYSQLTDDEEGGSGTDGEGTGDLVRNMNAATVAAAARERRELAKQESQRKKDKDKEDREKQKQLKEEKKEKRKTQKGERKR